MSQKHTAERSWGQKSHPALLLGLSVWPHLPPVGCIVWQQKHFKNWLILMLILNISSKIRHIIITLLQGTAKNSQNYCCWHQLCGFSCQWADFHSASSSCCSCASQSAWPLGNPRQRVLNRTKNHNVQRSVEQEAVKKQLRGSRVAHAASSKITNALHKVKRGKIKCLCVVYVALTVGG